MSLYENLKYIFLLVSPFFFFKLLFFFPPLIVATSCGHNSNRWILYCCCCHYNGDDCDGRFMRRRGVKCFFRPKKIWAHLEITFFLEINSISTPCKTWNFFFFFFTFLYFLKFADVNLSPFSLAINKCPLKSWKAMLNHVNLVNKPRFISLRNILRSTLDRNVDWLYKKWINHVNLDLETCERAAVVDLKWAHH